VVTGVIQQAMLDTGATGLLVLEDTTPEGRLVLDWSASALGASRVHRAPADTANGWMGAFGSDPGVIREVRRAAARVLADQRNWLLAHPANKTELLLSHDLPPERLLPLGDLYATQIQELTGGYTLSAEVDSMITAAGSVAAVDGALAAWLEGRNDLDVALSSLVPEAQNRLRTRLAGNRCARRWPRIVPKLGSRTLWVDLFA
jgi:hypothetical protein